MTNLSSFKLHYQLFTFFVLFNLFCCNATPSSKSVLNHKMYSKRLLFFPYTVLSRANLVEFSVLRLTNNPVEPALLSYTHGSCAFWGQQIRKWLIIFARCSCPFVIVKLDSFGYSLYNLIKIHFPQLHFSIIKYISFVYYYYYNVL